MVGAQERNVKAPPPDGPLGADPINQPLNRKFHRWGFIWHSFPTMTPVEKAFLSAYAISGAVVVFVASTDGTQISPSAAALLALCACLMGCTVGYWLRREPQACLDLCVNNWWVAWFPPLLILYLIVRRRRQRPFAVEWPSVVLFLTRVFGACVFLACIVEFPQFIGTAIVPGWPSAWTAAPGIALLYHATAVVIAIYVLRRRHHVFTMK